MRLSSKWLLCVLASVAPIFAQAGGPLNITSTSPLPNATQNSPYEFDFVANVSGALVWSLTSGTILPKGLDLDRSSGRLSGTPTEQGNFSIGVNVEDGQKRQASAGFLLQVKPPLVITTPSPISATAGSSLTIVLSATGGTPAPSGYFWQVAPGSQLPSWLKIDPQSPDFLTGTPPAAGTFSFTVQVTDSGLSSPATKQLTIVVQPAISITTASQYYFLITLDYERI